MSNQSHSQLHASVAEVVRQAVVARPGMFRLRTRAIDAVASELADAVCRLVDGYVPGEYGADPQAADRAVRTAVLVEVEDALMELNPKAGRRKALEAVQGIEGYEPREQDGSQ